MTRAATSRLEFRIRPESRQTIQQAAALLALPVGDFVRTAAEERAEEVIREQGATAVPADFFNALLDALDQPPQPNAALRRASQRRHKVVDAR
jgi:uncharacterized protein (DUF1778 family)